MTKHVGDCNFEEKVQAGFCAGTGDGEISGTAKFGLDGSGCIKLSLTDGWSYPIYIEFEYCPICGVKLEKDDA